jgi:hypothetical protein
MVEVLLECVGNRLSPADSEMKKPGADLGEENLMAQSTAV